MILVGTVHYDLDGPRRLEHLLRRFAPRQISVEYNGSLKGIVIDHEFNKADAAEAVKKVDLPENLKQLFVEAASIYGYEVRIPLLYSLTVHHRGIATVDDNRPIRPRIDIDKELKYLIDAINRRRPINPELPYEHLRKSTVAYFDRAYNDGQIFEEIEKMFEELEIEVPEIEDPERRERVMAENIIGLRPDMHIGGMLHAFEYPDVEHSVTPLYKRLGDMVTQRIRLCEAFNY